MHTMMILATFSASLTTTLMALAWLVSKKTSMDREKSSPFECGFDPKSSSRLPFSLHFFLIAVIFLIFDVEITLIMPLIHMLKSSNPYSTLIISSLFVAILILGLLHEWKQGALNWTK